MRTGSNHHCTYRKDKNVEIQPGFKLGLLKGFYLVLFQVEGCRNETSHTTGAPAEGPGNETSRTTGAPAEGPGNETSRTTGAPVEEQRWYIS